METRFAQARGHLYETVEMKWEEVVANGSFPGNEWLPRTALATSSAVDAAIEVVTTLYRAAGSSAAFRSGRLDGCPRDIFTLGAHKTVQHMNRIRYRRSTITG